MEGGDDNYSLFGRSEREVWAVLSNPISLLFLLVKQLTAKRHSWDDESRESFDTK